MKTYFAPAERESSEDILQESSIISDNLIFKKIIDSMPQIFLVLNHCRQIVYGNRAIFDLLEKETCDVLGKRPGETLACVNGLSAEGGCGTAEACAQCGAVDAILRSLKGEEVLNECRIRIQTDETLILQVWTYPMKVNARDYVVMIATDISDAKKRQSLEKIFFHDVLNTAGGIFGYLKKISVENTNQIDRRRTTFNTLCFLTSKLIDEIKYQKQLLAAEQNTLKMHPDTVDSVDLLTEVSELYKNHDISQDKVMAVHPDSERATFKSDAVLLHRIIGNMAKNALEACKNGETVTLKCGIEGDTIEFSVNNPAYIPKDIQLQIFQRSFSTKGEGRGIGTYSMKLLSNRYLQGDVTFQTSEKEGTTFIARYPFLKSEETALKSLAPKPKKKEKHTASLEILLVEDNEISREVAKFFLEDAGCVVAEAKTGEEAIDILKNKTFDAVLMDVHMPGIGGIEAFRQIKQNYPEVPVIALTAEEDDEVYGKNFGMDDAVYKPFESDQLLKVIEKWVNR